MPPVFIDYDYIMFNMHTISLRSRILSLYHIFNCSLYFLLQHRIQDCTKSVLLGYMGEKRIIKGYILGLVEAASIRFRF